MLQKGRVWCLLVRDKLQRRILFLQLFIVTLGVTYFLFTLDVAIPIPVVTNKPHTRLQEWLKGNITADSNNSIHSHMALHDLEKLDEKTGLLRTNLSSLNHNSSHPSELNDQINQEHSNKTNSTQGHSNQEHSNKTNSTQGHSNKTNSTQEHSNQEHSNNINSSQKHSNQEHFNQEHSNQHHPTTSSQKQVIPTRRPKFTKRFRFTQDISKFRLGGPAVNPVPGGVKFRHQPREGVICNTTGPFILATVPSSLGNIKRRNAIRRTWAHPKLYPYTGLRAVFVVGKTMDPLVQKSLDEEAERYGDLLQYNYIDSYRNLSYKTSSLLTWAATRCPKFTFLAKVDDDVLVNPFNLVTFLWHQLIKLLPVPPYQALEHPRAEGVRLFNHTTNATQVIYGRVENFHKPHRKGRWGLTETEYPETHYPAFVLGPAYIVGHRGVRRLLKYLPYTPMVSLEDVYMTGLVAHAAGVPRVPASTYYDSKTPARFFMVETSEPSRNFGWASIINKHRDKDNKPLLTVPPDLRLSYGESKT